VFEAFLSDPAVASQWRRFGGLETLHSYGVSVAAVMVGKGFEEASAALRYAVPEEHFRFLGSLQLATSWAIISSATPGSDPVSAEDLLWIRDEFLNSRTGFGKIIVHGHSPAAEPEILPNRINVDTGAYATGRLTCLVLEPGSRRFISAQ
jgi:serine/threonine protein phosphatase 1